MEDQKPEDVEKNDSPEVPGKKEAPTRTAEELLATAARLLKPWHAQLTMIGKAYLKEYPPLKTRADVIQAVTVQVPMTAYLAMMTAVSATLLHELENAPLSAADARLDLQAASEAEGEGENEKE